MKESSRSYITVNWKGKLSCFLKSFSLQKQLQSFYSILQVVSISYVINFLFVPINAFFVFICISSNFYCLVVVDSDTHPNNNTVNILPSKKRISFRKKIYINVSVSFLISITPKGIFDPANAIQIH